MPPCSRLAPSPWQWSPRSWGWVLPRRRPPLGDHPRGLRPGHLRELLRGRGTDSGRRWLARLPREDDDTRRRRPALLHRTRHVRRRHLHQPGHRRGATNTGKYRFKTVASLTTRTERSPSSTSTRSTHGSPTTRPGGGAQHRALPLRLGRRSRRHPVRSHGRHGSSSRPTSRRPAWSPARAPCSWRYSPEETTCPAEAEIVRVAFGAVLLSAGVGVAPATAGHGDGGSEACSQPARLGPARLVRQHRRPGRRPVRRRRGCPSYLAYRSRDGHESRRSPAVFPLKSSPARVPPVTSRSSTGPPTCWSSSSAPSWAVPMR